MGLRALNKNIVYLFLVQFFNYIGPLLVIPFLTRIFTIEEFGLFSVYSSIIVFAFVITDLGFNLACTNLIAKKNSEADVNSINKISTSALIAKAIVLKVLLLICITIALVSSKVGFLQVLAIYFPIAMQAFFLNWFFQGIEKMKGVTATFAASKCLYLVLVVLFINPSSTVYHVFFFLGVSNFIAAIVSIYIARANQFRFVLVTKKDVLDLILYSLNFFFSRLAVSIYTSINTVVIGYFTSLPQAALFGAVEKVYQGVQSLTSPISQALYPFLSRTKNRKAFFKYLLLSSIPLLFFLIIVAFNSKFLILLLFGEAYVDSFNVLNVFLICSLITFLSVNFGYPAFSLLGRLDIANKTTYLGLLTQIFGLLYCLLFNIELNALNVVTLVLITEVSVLLIRLFFFITLSRGSK